MNRRFWILGATLLALMVTFGLGFVASAEGLGVLGLQPAGQVRMAAVSAFDAINTTSTTFVDLPNLTTTFKVPTGKHADIVIQFSGSMNSPSALYVRAVVDGVAADPNNSGNGPQMFWDVSGGATAQAFNFYKFGVPQGSHTVKMQWDGLSGSQFMSYRSMVVLVNIR